jgi:hypothetical protein
MRFFTKLFLMFLLLVSAKSAYSQAVVVNEYFNAFSQKGEFVELLIIQNNTDLRNYMLRDFSGTGNPQAPLRFSNNPYWANLRAGTLIAITNDTSLYVQDTSKSDFSILIKKTTDTTYVTGNIFNIAVASDAVQLVNRNDTTHVHGVSHGPGNLNSLPAPKAHFTNALSGGGNPPATPITGAVLKFTKATIMTLADFGNNANIQIDTLTQTAGQPNDALGNLQYITALRTGSAVVNISNVPDGFALSQNYPNPFNPVTKIQFSLPSAGFTTLKVFDVLGKEVNSLVSSSLHAGTYEINFDGSGLNSGIYFYTLQFLGADGKNLVDTKKFMLTK